MRSSTLVLLINGVFAILMLALFLGIFIWCEQRDSPPTSSSVPPLPPAPAVTCNGPGKQPTAPVLPYQRILSYSNASPYANGDPSFLTVSHTVPKLTRLRGLSGAVSPNHWLGSAMYGEENEFLCYPYLASVSDTGLLWAWPSTGTIQQICDNEPCTIGQAQLIYQSSMTDPLFFTCSGQSVASCDIVNVDALTAAIDWQFVNPGNGQLSSFRAIFCQGCPYLTIENRQCSLTIEAALTETTPFTGGYLLSTATRRYVLFLPPSVSIVCPAVGIYQLPPFEGYLRIAAYHNDAELQSLIAYADLYPIESEIDSRSTLASSTWITSVDYIFATRGTGASLLMCQLPHQILSSSSVVAGPYAHPLLGPYQLITTPDNQWHLSFSTPDTGITYPPSNNSSLLATWKNDVDSITALVPSEPVDWMRWLGSLANLILLGVALQQDVSYLVSFLTNQLARISIYNGMVTNEKVFLYDEVWNGITTSAGMTQCDGVTDEGNAFYHSHIGHHGYLLFAYAVAVAHNDSTFLEGNRDKILYFTRSLLNASADDSTFPLWRHQHWYLGYSLLTGLEPAIEKSSTNVGEVTAGYYAGFLLGKVLELPELINWSLAYLGTESSSARVNFQFGSLNAINVDTYFVQGTITERTDTSYRYTTIENTSFPEKNASAAIPMLKPVMLSSQFTVDSTWLSVFRQYVIAGLSGVTEAETLAYGEMVAVTPSTLNTVLATLLQRSSEPLPPGSLWSAVVYWIIATYSSLMLA